jgi:membrane associated rhomboid family serine protease
MFLHANTMHLFFNLFFQLRIGFGMEKQFGTKKFVLLYFVCGFLGNLMSILVDPFKLAVGASTAGFGLIGVWLAELLLSWNVLGPARSRALVWVAFMLTSIITMSAIAPNVDLFGHFGGCLAGFLLGLWVAEMPPEVQPTYYGQVRKAAAAFLCLFCAFGLTKIFLFSPATPLPNCGHLLSLRTQ